MAEDVARKDEYQDVARSVVQKGIADYCSTEDYKKLAQYDPDFAQEIAKADFKIGAAPLLQVVRLKGIAWGERYHFSSYDHSKIRDAHIKKSFVTDPIVFLKNSDEVSDETLRKALDIFGLEQGLVQRLTDTAIRRISRKAGEEALEAEFGGWSGVYTDCDRCSDLSIEDIQAENYLNVNPITIECLRGAEKQTIVVGYLIAKDTAYFDVVLLGAAAEQAFQQMQKRKKNKKIALITLSCLVPILAIAGYIGYYAIFGGGLSAMPLYQWFASLFG